MTTTLAFKRSDSLYTIEQEATRRMQITHCSPSSNTPAAVCCGALRWSKPEAITPGPVRRGAVRTVCFGDVKEPPDSQLPHVSRTAEPKQNTNNSASMVRRICWRHTHTCRVVRLSRTAAIRAALDSISQPRRVATGHTVTGWRVWVGACTHQSSITAPWSASIRLLIYLASYSCLLLLLLLPPPLEFLARVPSEE